LKQPRVDLPQHGWSQPLAELMQHPDIWQVSPIAQARK